jgi:hypothetical protein
MALFTQMATIYADGANTVGTKKTYQYGMEVTHYDLTATTIYPGQKLNLCSIRVLPNAQIAWGWLQRSIGKVDLSGLVTCIGQQGTDFWNFMDQSPYLGFYAVDSTGTVSPCVWTIPLKNAANYQAYGTKWPNHTNTPANPDSVARMPLVNQPVQDNGYLLITLELPKDAKSSVVAPDSFTSLIHDLSVPITISTELS